MGKKTGKKARREQMAVRRNKNAAAREAQRAKGEEVMFGIDVGNSSVKIAIFQQSDPEPRVLANAAGNRSTPTCASIAEPVMTGYEASKNSYRLMKTLVQYPLQALRHTDPDVAAKDPYVARRGGPKVKSKDGKVSWLIRWFPEPEDDQEEEEEDPEPVEKFVSATEVISTILKLKVKPIAEATAPNCTHCAVLTIPSDSTKAFCSSICVAVTKAGFKVRQVIRTSAAGALAYELDDPTLPAGGTPDSPNLVLALDVGCLTTTATVMLLRPGGFIEIMKNKTEKVGVVSLEEELVKFFNGEFKRRNKFEFTESAKSVEKVMCNVRKLLPVLSTSQEAHIDIEAVADGVDLNSRLTRARMEMVTTNTMNKIIAVASDLLKETDFTKENFAHILHLGGGLAITRLKTRLRDLFPKATHHDSLEPAFASALGAARQARLVGQLPKHRAKKKGPATHPALENYGFTQFATTTQE